MHDAARMAVPAAFGRLHLARTVAAHDPKEEDPLTREITAFHAEWLRSIDNPI